jgi:hypothetical protein
MAQWQKLRWPAAMAIGLAAGLVLSGFWPYTPLHAVSTDRADTFAMATGPVDGKVEAVYFLDFLTGDLGALVLGETGGTWSGSFTYNVSRDLAVDPQKNPKFMMVTGMATIRRAGGTRLQPSAAACYVAEINSGLVAAYGIPWSPQAYNAGQMQPGRQLIRLAPPTPFRAAAGGGPGIGPPSRTPKARERDREKE